jgi:hypothetical protein
VPLPIVRKENAREIAKLIRQGVSVTRIIHEEFRAIEFGHRIAGTSTQAINRKGDTMEYVMKDLGYKRTPTKALFRVEMGDKEIIGDV